MRIAAMAYAIGVTENRIADTYNLANTTPNIVFELALGGILSSVLMRVYIEVRDQDGQEQGWLFIARMTNIAIVALVALAAIGMLAAPWILHLYTLGSHSADTGLRRQVGTLLLRLFVPQVIFYGYSQISTAVLQAHRRYGVTNFAPVLNNMVVSATFLAFAATVPRNLRNLRDVPWHGLLLLGIGTTLGVVVMGMTPYLYMRRVGYKRPRRAGFKDPRLGRLAKLSAYLFGYVATNQLGLWVPYVLAYRIRGGVAAYQTAFVFFQLPHGLLAVSIAVVIYTRMTESAVAGDTEAFARNLNQGVRGIAFVILPAIAGYMAIAPLLIRMLLQHGVAGGGSTALIALVLRWWAVGIFFFSTFYVLLRGFYALGDTRTPMLVNLGAFAVNVVVDVALFRVLKDPSSKLAGLAVGHGLSYLVAAAVLFWLMRRRVGASVSAGVAMTLARAVFAAALTGGAALVVSRVLIRALGSSNFAAELATVAASTLVGLLVYVSTSALLRSEELKWVLAIVRRRND